MAMSLTFGVFLDFQPVCSPCGLGPRELSLQSWFVWRAWPDEAQSLPSPCPGPETGGFSLPPPTGGWWWWLSDSPVGGQQSSKTFSKLHAYTLRHNHHPSAPCCRLPWLSQATQGNHEIRPVGPGTCSGPAAYVETACPRWHLGPGLASPEHHPSSLWPGQDPVTGATEC